MPNYRAPNGLKSSKSIAIYIQNAALFSNPVFKVQNEKFFWGVGEWKWKRERGEAQFYAQGGSGSSNFKMYRH
jgi:hypothetical protein